MSEQCCCDEAVPLPLSQAGIGLKAQHYGEILERRPAVGWFEVHPENYMGAGGPPHRYLEAIRVHYPLSLHSVGLSLGSAEGIDDDHLARLKDLVERYQPALVSDHLSWSSQGGAFLNDLLPLPYNTETLNLLVDNIDHVQDRLGRAILIENPSRYHDLEGTTKTEPELLNALSEQTGCGLLLDVNNLHVSSINLGLDAERYLADLDHHHVEEIHLAGHSQRLIDERPVLIDDHGSAVTDAVWDLFDRVVAIGGPRPTLIEWDNAVPDLDILLGQAEMATQRLDAYSRRPDRAAVAG